MVTPGDPVGRRFREPLGYSGSSGLPSALGDARFPQLGITHRSRERQPRHRELHARGVDMTFGVQARHHPADVATADPNRAGEVVETHETSSRLLAGEVSEDVSGDGLRVDVDM